MPIERQYPQLCNLLPAFNVLQEELRAIPAVGCHLLLQEGEIPTADILCNADGLRHPRSPWKFPTNGSANHEAP